MKKKIIFPLFAISILLIILLSIHFIKPQPLISVLSKQENLKDGIVICFIDKDTAHEISNVKDLHERDSKDKDILQMLKEIDVVNPKRYQGIAVGNGLYTLGLKSKKQYSSLIRVTVDENNNIYFNKRKYKIKDNRYDLYSLISKKYDCY